MQRRELLKSIGGIGTATALGAGGFAAFAGSAAAASSELSIGNSSVSNDDGDLSEVVVSLSHNASWDGFDVGVDAVSYTDKITITDESGTQRGQHTLLDDYIVDLSELSGGTWGNNESYQFEVQDEDDTGPEPSVLDGTMGANIKWTILIDPTATASENSIQTPATIGSDVDDLDVQTDDSTVTYTITYEKTVKLYKEDGSGNFVQLGSDDGTVAATTAKGDFTVSVGNEPASTSSSGDGSSSAS